MSLVWMILLFVNRVAPKNALLSSGPRTAAWVSLRKTPGGGGRAISERRATRSQSRAPPSARVRTRERWEYLPLSSASDRRWSNDGQQNVRDVMKGGFPKRLPSVQRGKGTPVSPSLIWLPTLAFEPLSFSLTYGGRHSLQTEGNRVLDDITECLKQTKKESKTDQTRKIVRHNLATEQQ